MSLEPPSANTAPRYTPEAGALMFVESLPLQVWTARPDGLLDFVSGQVVNYVGQPAEQILEIGWLEFIHPSEREATIARWADALRSATPYEADFRLRRLDGEYRWHLARAVPFLDAGGSVTRWFGTNTDIEDERRIDAARREGEIRASFLASASRDLADSLEYEQTLRNVARLAVPDFADWCAVDLVRSGGELHRVAVAHPDPHLVELAYQLQERYPPDRDSPHGVYEVIRTGRSEWMAEIPFGLIEQAAQDEEHLEILRGLQLRSYVVAPLITRDQVLGAITFVYAESGRTYHEADVAFVEDLARRAATAIENSRLVRDLEEARKHLEEQASELEMQSEELYAQAAQLEEQTIELEMSNDELQRTAEQLRRNEALLAEAQTTAHVGSWDWDVATNAVSWTEELFRIYRMDPTPGPVNFDTYLSRIHPDDREIARAVIDAAMTDRQPYAVDHRIVWPDGSIRYVHGRGRVVVDDDGQPIRLTGSAQDVTDLRLAEREANEARQEAERANKAKSEFLAAMSHELRTPLNAIAGHLDIIDIGIHGPVTDPQREAFRRIKINQEYLLGLINDILQFARVEAGRLEFRSEALDIDRVVGDVLHMLQPEATAQGLMCGYIPTADAPRVLGDPERLQQILINLLSNAIKFTRPGGSITVTSEVVGPDLLVHVDDTGCGIPAEMLSAIFDPFVQGGRRHETLRQGVGLGLAISRDLARGMGGDISVESVVDQGSRFTLRLQIA